MFTLKDTLCLLAIFFAYGITGHMDYEDAVMLEATQRPLRPSASTDCWPTFSSPTNSPASQVHRLGASPQRDDLSDHACGPSPEASELCPPVIY